MSNLSARPCDCNVRPVYVVDLAIQSKVMIVLGTRRLRLSECDTRSVVMPFDMMRYDKISHLDTFVCIQVRSYLICYD